jgi:hypothetical protein
VEAPRVGSEARQIYALAAQSGHKVALIEQERANIFTNSVAKIGPGEKRSRSACALTEKLESPVVTNLAATFSDAPADATPNVLPDLYRGEALVLAARLERLSGTLDISGRIGERAWMLRLPAGWDFDALFGAERPTPLAIAPERRANLMPPTTAAAARTWCCRAPPPTRSSASCSASC